MTRRTPLHDADERANGHLTAVTTGAAYAADDGTALTPLEYIGRQLHAEILSVTKIGLTNCRWDIAARHRRGDERTVSVPTATLQSKAKMKAAIFEVTGLSIPAGVTPTIWENIVQAVEDAADEIDHGGNELELWTGRILLFASERAATRNVDLTITDEKAAQLDGEHEIFTDTTGHLYVHAESLHHWLRIARKVYVEVDDVRTALAAIRWKSEKVSARSRTERGKTRGRHFWRSPEPFDAGDVSA